MAYMRAHIILLTFVFLIGNDLFAQNSFLRIYPGQPTIDPEIYVGSIPLCLEKTNAGGFLIGGYTGNPDSLGLQLMQLRKIDSQGNEIWNQRDRITTFDQINDVVETADNFIYCAAIIGNRPAVIKRDANGAIVWWVNLTPFTDTCGGLNRIIKTSDGNLVVCGAQGPCGSSDEADILIVKLDTGGQILWKKSFPIVWNNSALDIVEANDTAYYITGYTNEIDTVNAFTKTFLASVKSMDGQLNWLKTYGTAHIGFSLIQQTNNTFIIGGGR